SARQRVREDDELARVSRMRDREIGRQQVVLLILRHLDAQRDAAEVLFAVGLSGWGRIREAHRGRIAPAGLREAGAQIVREVAAEGQLATTAGQDGFGVKGASDARRLAALPGLELRAHHQLRQLLELAALRFRRAALVDLAPLADLQSLLARLGWF